MIKFPTGWSLLSTCLCSAALAQALPPEVDAALNRAKVPREAVSLLVMEAEGRAPPRLSHRAQVPMNPASVMKLVTTYAASTCWARPTPGRRRCIWAAPFGTARC